MEGGMSVNTWKEKAIVKNELPFLLSDITPF
jgi:hypothetical protein